jgi:hypothetical protein
METQCRECGEGIIYAEQDVPGMACPHCRKGPKCRRCIDRCPERRETEVITPADVAVLSLDAQTGALKIT